MMIVTTIKAIIIITIIMARVVTIILIRIITRAVLVLNNSHTNSKNEEKHTTNTSYNKYSAGATGFLFAKLARWVIRSFGR